MKTYVKELIVQRNEILPTNIFLQINLLHFIVLYILIHMVTFPSNDYHAKSNIDLIVLSLKYFRSITIKHSLAIFSFHSSAFQYYLWIK